MLGGIVDHAHQPHPARHMRSPGRINHVIQISLAQTRDIPAQRRGGRTQIIGQQCGILHHDGTRLLRSMPVAHRVAQLAQVEAGIEPLTMPHLWFAIQLRELRIHLPPRMPQQPGDRIRMPTRVRVQCPCRQGVYEGFRFGGGSACGFTQNIAGIHSGSFIRGKHVYH